MGIADDLARHNAETAAQVADRLRHEKLHVGPPPQPVRSCRLCRYATELERIDAMVRSGKMVKG